MHINIDLVPTKKLHSCMEQGNHGETLYLTNPITKKRKWNMHPTNYTICYCSLECSNQQ